MAAGPAHSGQDKMSKALVGKRLAVYDWSLADCFPSGTSVEVISLGEQKPNRRASRGLAVEV